MIRADGDCAARSSVSGRKVVLLPSKKHGLSLQPRKGSTNTDGQSGKAPSDSGKSDLAPASMCAQTGCSSWPSPCSQAQLGCSVSTYLWTAVIDSD